jgi:hypothetical protein
VAGTVDVEYERDVLATCLRDQAFLRTALPVLRDHHFTDATLAWLWAKLAETYGASREVPTPRLWTTYVDREYEDEDADYVINVLRSLLRRRVVAPKSALEEVRRFVRMATARGAVDDVLDALDKGDVDKAVGVLLDSATEARGSGMAAEPRVWAEEWRTRLVDYTTATSRVSFKTGLPAVDRLTTGGLRAGALGLVVANTNVGKSTFAVHLGFQGLLDGHAVVHVTTEETDRECQARYDARFTGISRSILLSGRLTEEEKDSFADKFKRRGGEILDRLLVQEMPPGSDVGGVRAVVEMMRDRHPTLPLLLVVDSPDHLRPSRKVESFRLEQSQVYWTIKGSCLDSRLGPLAAWCTTQAPKAFEGKTITTAAVSETYDKARIADFMFGLMEGDASTAAKAAGRATVEGIIVKNRLGGAKKWKVYMEGDLGLCEFRETGSREETEE